MQARFPEGTFERIASVLVGKEDRTDFVPRTLPALQFALDRFAAGKTGKQKG